jgi:hypothetical protein
VVVFRCTRKLLDRLDRPARPAASDRHSTALLGDWYVELLFVRPQRLLLFVSESTRLPIVLPARELAAMAPRFGVALTDTLRALNIDAPFIARELGAMQDVAFATTQSRSVLGTINDFAFQLQWLMQDKPTLTLHQLSVELADTPIRPLHDYPARATRRLLLEKPVG